MKSIFIISATAIVFFSCGAGNKKGSSSVDQSKISTDYHVYYTEDGASLRGDISFTSPAKGFHFDSYELDGNSSVTFDGKAMKPTTTPIIGGVTYDFNIKGDGKPHAFLYIDNNNKTYSNAISYDPLLVTSVKRYLKKDGEWSENNDVPLDTSGVVLIKLSRMPLDGESIDVYLEGTTGVLENDAFDLQTTNETGEGYLDASDSTVMFWPDPSNYKESRKIKFQVRCNLEKDAVAPAAGGKISYSWMTKEQWFEYSK